MLFEAVMLLHDKGAAGLVHSRTTCLPIDKSDSFTALPLTSVSAKSAPAGRCCQPACAATTAVGNQRVAVSVRIMGTPFRFNDE